MERSLRRISKSAALITLPLYAAIVGCNNDSNSKEIPTTLYSQTAAPIIDSDESQKRDILSELRERNKGAVFVNIERYQPDLSMDLKLDLIQVGEEGIEVIDSQTIHVVAENRNPITNVFVANDCDGEYSLSVSTNNGITYRPVSTITDASKPSSNTFKLDNNCSQEFYLTNPAQPTSTP